MSKRYVEAAPTVFLIQKQSKQPNIRTLWQEPTFSDFLSQEDEVTGGPGLASPAPHLLPWNLLSSEGQGQPGVPFLLCPEIGDWVESVGTCSPWFIILRWLAEAGAERATAGQYHCCPHLADRVQCHNSREYIVILCYIFQMVPNQFRPDTYQRWNRSY